MVSPANVKYGKGWFLGIGRDGDRTLEQQMTGLEQVLSEVRGKTVIDAGCAEGLISIEMARAGAKSCLGLEVVPSHVAMARDLAAGLPCKFVVADLNSADLEGTPKADIVLLLAILHKLKDPTKACVRFAELTLDLCVVRLPPSGPTILDQRSDFVPHDIVAVMATRGLALENVVQGPLGEWTGYFRRPNAAKAAPPKLALKFADSLRFPDEPIRPTDETFSAMSETNIPKDAPITSSTVTVGPDDETPQSETAPAPPPPADELKVSEGEGKIEGGRTLFPTVGRRGRRGDATVREDPPKSDKPK